MTGGDGMTQPMERTRTRARTAVVDLLSRIAPGTDLDAVPPDADLRVELDLDSMDFLAFVVGLHGSVGVTVPEEDYPAMTTMAGALDYLVPRMGG